MSEKSPQTPKRKLPNNNQFKNLPIYQPESEVKKRIVTEHTPLTVREHRFVDAVVKGGDTKEAVKEAGYKVKESGLTSKANSLISKPNVAMAIQEGLKEYQDTTVMTGKEVMEYFTAVVRGELKDQFGLEVSIADRTVAAKEIARRTIDLEQKLEASRQEAVSVNLNWKRE